MTLRQKRVIGWVALGAVWVTCYIVIPVIVIQAIMRLVKALWWS